jgi:hypothetical protein
MYIWRVVAENINEEGLFVTIYDNQTNMCVEIHYEAQFPDVVPKIVLYPLRDDFKLRVTKYQNLPKEFEYVVKSFFETQEPRQLNNVLLDRFVYSTFLEYGNVAKTRGNLQDIGHVFH